MAVIGRLDDQVEEVIIAPIARRHERQRQERDAVKREPYQEEGQTPADKERESDASHSAGGNE